MRKSVLLFIALLLGLVTGCGGGVTPPPASPSPTLSPSPTSAPSPTPIPETDTAESTVAPEPSGPATCELFTLPVASNIPPVTEEEHIHGSEDAAITFIEYADFQCPACSALSTLRVYLEDTHGENFRSVYRHFALSFHDKAIITAEATEAAGAQGKFWEIHDLIYERQQEWNPLSVDETRTKLIEYAEELELDVERFTQELDDHVYKDKVDADTQSAIEIGLGGTPSYIINGVVYPTQQLGLQPILIDAFIRLTLLTEEQYTELPPQVVDAEKDYVATIRTSKGDIVVELFDDQAPVNVNNFVFLAQEGWYDDLTFFHVEPGFVAQSGDPTNVGLGFPYPGYFCGDETSPDLTFDEAGMVALYTSSPGRNSSQFFITYAPQPDFSGTYTIIGKIVEGMDVTESLAKTQPGAEDSAPDVIETILIEEE